MSEHEAKVKAVRMLLVDIFWERGPQDFTLSAERVIRAIEQVEITREYAV